MKCLNLISCFLIALIGSAGADSFAEKVVLATYKLFNETSAATSFVVEGKDGKRYLVSAAHVFENGEGEQSVLVMRKKKADGTYLRHDQKIKVRDGKKPLWVKHPEQDVAVLELKVKPPADVEIYAVAEAALATGDSGKKGGLGVGSDVLICGYPTRFEVNKAGFPVTRRGCVASFPISPVASHPTMLVDFTTFEGDSGGPVFLKSGTEGEEPLVVGLVVSQFWHTEKLKTFSGRQTINHSLGLSTITQATSILETLEVARGKKKESKEK